MSGRTRLAVFVALSAAAIAVAVALLWWAMHPLPAVSVSQAEIEAYIEGLGAWGPLASILLMVLHSFIPFPAEFVAIANGMVFGAVWGTVLTWTGAMLGAYLAFGLARLLGPPVVRRLLGARKREALDRWTAREGPALLLFSRLIPVISFNLINYAAGLMAVSWWTFTWTTGLGILPVTLVSVLLGDSIWSGAPAIWIALLGSALAGWTIWHVVIRRRLADERC